MTPPDDRTPEEAGIAIEKHYQYCFGCGSDKYSLIESADPFVVNMVKAQRDAAVKEKQETIDALIRGGIYHEEIRDKLHQQIARLTAEEYRIRKAFNHMCYTVKKIFPLMQETDEFSNFMEALRGMEQALENSKRVELDPIKTGKEKG